MGCEQRARISNARGYERIVKERYRGAYSCSAYQGTITCTLFSRRMMFVCRRGPTIALEIELGFTLYVDSYPNEKRAEKAQEGMQLAFACLCSIIVTHLCWVFNWVGVRVAAWGSTAKECGESIFKSDEVERKERKNRYGSD